MFYEEFGTTELVRISSDAAKEHFSAELDVQKKPFPSIAALQNQIEILEKHKQKSQLKQICRPTTCIFTKK